MTLATNSPTNNMGIVGPENLEGRVQHAQPPTTTPPPAPLFGGGGDFTVQNLYLPA